MSKIIDSISLFSKYLEFFALQRILIRNFIPRKKIAKVKFKVKNINNILPKNMVKVLVKEMFNFFYFFNNSSKIFLKKIKSKFKDFFVLKDL